MPNTIDGYKSFKEQIADNVKLIVILQFIMNFYSFSFPVELILGFFTSTSIIFLYFIDSATTMKDEGTKTVKIFFSAVLIIVNAPLLFYAVWKVFSNYHSIFNIESIKSFLLPIVLLLWYLPLIYFLTLRDTFLTLVGALDIALKNIKESSWLALRICIKKRFSVEKISKINKYYIMARFLKLRNQKIIQE